MVGHRLTTAVRSDWPAVVTVLRLARYVNLGKANGRRIIVLASESNTGSENMKLLVAVSPQASHLKPESRVQLVDCGTCFQKKGGGFWTQITPDPDICIHESVTVSFRVFEWGLCLYVNGERVFGGSEIAADLLVEQDTIYLV